MTVVAADIRSPFGIVRGHWGSLHLPVHLKPRQRHVTIGLHADGAGSLVCLLQLVQAAAVDSVSARQHSCWQRAVKQEVEANRAVLAHAVLYAYVIALQLLVVAAPARIAVEEPVSAPNSADAAGIAVKLLLIVSVLEEGALQAYVRAESCSARAAVWRDGLLSRTKRADNLPYSGSIKLMPSLWVLFVIVHDLVVAMPAPEHLRTAWGHQLTAATVVAAPIRPLPPP
mmetsp:Transcript_20693/g.62369  ORF Transcript_20693/g.62369 Transcript_20693/m.62369 type:complete len:228 (-) Transcript_20693:615-1298(-)